MTYIKLLTVLAGLALLTACGGSSPTTPANNSTGGDNSGGDNSGGGGGGGNATDCTQTPFHNDCLRNNAPALLLRQTMCLADSTTDDSCGAVIEGVCMDDPFHSNATCTADTYLPNRIAECIKGGEADEGKCATITTDAEKSTMLTACLENPFDIVCKTSVTDFVTYADTARMNRLDFCDNSGNVANDFCTGNNLVIICGVDPFNAICFTDDTYLSPRVADCIKAENTEAEKCNTLLSDTAMNTELTDCLTNPFATACESVTAFTDFALARTNRLTFCNDSDNVANGLCTGENLMNVCVADSFNAICFAGDTYLPARVNNCITDGNAGETKCDNLFTASASNTCLTNPFTDACKADGAFGTYADMARTKRITFCEIGGNESNALCMDTTLTNLCEFRPFSTACTGHPNTPNLRVASCLNDAITPKDPSCTEILLVNHADYLATFATPPHATVAAAVAVASTAILSHFLSVGEGGIDTTGLGDVTPVTLRLGGDNDDEGDNPNGVTFVDGEIEREIQGFVGLLPTTNLGAPLVEAPMDTTWEGRYLSGLDLTTYPITFTVNFGTKKITGADTQTYITDFDLDFTATGVITGNVSASLGGRTDTAPVRGLIGEQGLVGAFANTDGGTRGGTFYGGFVAENPDYTAPMNGN